ncbi:carbohydrate ABC transporter permease, partial [Pseudomonas aeruginosa]
MLLTSFKREIDAFATPPQFTFQPPLEIYLHINERRDYFAYAWKPLLISSSPTLLCMLVAVRPACSMAFFEPRPTRRT